MNKLKFMVKMRAGCISRYLKGKTSIVAVLVIDDISIQGRPLWRWFLSKHRVLN